ncbi:MAG: hypothetical protein ABIG92_03490 [Candidatus Omnitrophota bacterium]
MKKRAFILGLILISIFCFNIMSIAEEVLTLTTYYPSPTGVYTELKTTYLAVGSGTAMPSSDGDVNIGGGLDVTGSVSAGNGDSSAGTYTIQTVIPGTTISLTVVNGIVTQCN